MAYPNYGKSVLPYYGKGIEKYKYFRVVNSLWLREKSIQILKHRMSKFSDNTKGMGKLREFTNYGFLNKTFETS